MTDFAVGDKVVVRFGERQGQEGEIIEVQLAHVYKVKLANGSVLFYSWSALDREDLLTTASESG